MCKNVQVEGHAVKKVIRNIDLIFAAGSKCEESRPTVEYYDVNRNIWTDHSFMKNGGRYNLSLSVIQEEDKAVLFAFGGRDGDGQAIKTI
jgi:chitinase